MFTLAKTTTTIACYQDQNIRKKHRQRLPFNNDILLVAAVICIVIFFPAPTSLLTHAYLTRPLSSTASRRPQFTIATTTPTNRRTTTSLSFVSTLSLSRTRRITSSTKRRVSSSTRLYVTKSGGKMISTEEQFADMVLAKDIPRPVLVFFTAPWCGPCRLTVPVVKDVMKQYSNEIDVVEVCTDDLAEVAETAGVVSIPTIQFYYGGQTLEAHSIVGCVAKSVLANAVEKVLDDVAQQQTAATTRRQEQ